MAELVNFLELFRVLSLNNNILFLEKKILLFTFFQFQFLFFNSSGVIKKLDNKRIKILLNMFFFRFYFWFFYFLKQTSGKLLKNSGFCRIFKKLAYSNSFLIQNSSNFFNFFFVFRDVFFYNFYFYYFVKKIKNVASTSNKFSGLISSFIILKRAEYFSFWVKRHFNILRTVLEGKRKQKKRDVNVSFLESAKKIITSDRSFVVKRWLVNSGWLKTYKIFRSKKKKTGFFKTVYNRYFYNLFFKIKKNFRFQLNKNFFKIFIKRYKFLNKNKNFFLKNYFTKYYYCVIKTARINTFVSLINKKGELIKMYSANKITFPYKIKKRKRRFKALRAIWRELVYYLRYKGIRRFTVILNAPKQITFFEGRWRRYILKRTRIPIQCIYRVRISHSSFNSFKKKKPRFKKKKTRKKLPKSFFKRARWIGGMGK